MKNMWDEVRTGFQDAARGVARFIDNDAWEWWTPAVGDWNLLDLTNHMMRALSAPARHASEAPPTGATISSAAGYYAIYLAERAEDPELDLRVTRRAADHELVASTVVAAFDRAVAAAIAAVDAMEGERLATTPFGAMRMRDYLPTRTLELVVHGLDFAHAVDYRWDVPETALAQATALVADLARIIGKGEMLLMAATGRSWANAVFPVLV